MNRSPQPATPDRLLLPAFVAFAESDRAWVQGFLIPGLGGINGAVHTKDDFAEGKYDDEGNAHLIGNWDLRDGAVPVALMGGSYFNYPAILTDLVLIAEASFADDVSGFRCITDNE